MGDSVVDGRSGNVSAALVCMELVKIVVDVMRLDDVVAVCALSSVCAK